VISLSIVLTNKAGKNCNYTVIIAKLKGKSVRMMASVNNIQVILVELINTTMLTSIGICSTEVVVDYLRKLLAVECGEGKEPQLPDWDVNFLEELYYNVKLVAIKNKSE